MKRIDSYKNVISDDFGIRVNANESFKNISNCELEKAIKILKQVKFNRYPDNSCINLREAYSKVIGLDSKNIIAGNGSDEMISLIIGSLIEKGKIVLTLNPDFSMYDFYTSSNEGVMKKFTTNKDGSFNISEFIEFAEEINPKLIIFSNPNNPTGYALNNEKVIKLLESLPKTTVVIDEAYYEFYGQSIIRYIDTYKNLIVTRTLSKAWGLAAFRIGFLISNIKTVEKLNHNKVPYSLAEFSQRVGTMVLAHPEKILKDVEKIVYERERLYENLKSISTNGDLAFYKSKANFIFGRSVYKEHIKRALEQEGILIRYFNDDSFRITVGSTLDNDLVVNAIKKAMRKVEDI